MCAVWNREPPTLHFEQKTSNYCMLSTRKPYLVDRNPFDVGFRPLRSTTRYPNPLSRDLALGSDDDDEGDVKADRHVITENSGPVFLDISSPVAL